MRNLIRPAALLLYLLTLFVFLFGGMVYGSWSGAADGQGLAAGAIVLGYGLVFAAIALLGALYLAFQSPVGLLVKSNRILGIIAACIIAWLAYRFLTMERSSGQTPSPAPTAPATKKPAAPAMLIHQQEAGRPMGLGMFRPDFYNHRVLYFYQRLTPGKALMEHNPTDSLVFRAIDGGGFTIDQAPPWFVPDHLKLDYDMLFVRIRSLGRDQVELIMNTPDAQRVIVDRLAGEVLLWPEFLLTTHSVEFLPGTDASVRTKPLPAAALVRTDFSFMRPERIQADWMEVTLLDDDFQAVGSGWIRWRQEGRLLIGYALLS